MFKYECFLLLLSFSYMQTEFERMRAKYKSTIVEKQAKKISKQDPS